MSITVSVSMQVADFDDWKAVFDAREIDRAEAGIHAKAYQNVDDPNNARAIGTAPSKETFIAALKNQKPPFNLKGKGVSREPHSTGKQQQFSGARINPGYTYRVFERATIILSA